jgi:hypothetical protein
MHASSRLEAPGQPAPRLVALTVGLPRFGFSPVPPCQHRFDFRLKAPI